VAVKGCPIHHSHQAKGSGEEEGQRVADRDATGWCGRSRQKKPWVELDLKVTYTFAVG
jgi:hypothetical protein